MAKDKFAQWLGMNKCVQSGNDVLTFAKTVIPTNAKLGLVIAVHAIEFMVGDLRGVDQEWVAPFLATKPDLTLATLMPGSEGLIDWAEISTIATATGLGTFSVKQLHSYPMPFLIAHPALYLYATSAVTGATQTVRCRILFTFEKVSAEEFFEALAQFGT